MTGKEISEAQVRGAETEREIINNAMQAVGEETWAQLVVRQKIVNDAHDKVIAQMQADMDAGTFSFDDFS